MPLDDLNHEERCCAGLHAKRARGGVRCPKRAQWKVAVDEESWWCDEHVAGVDVTGRLRQPYPSMFGRLTRGVDWIEIPLDDPPAPRPGGE